MAGTTRRRDIQFLRGIALIAILLYHTKSALFPHGFLGVDLFFIISGFVVTPLMLRIFERKSGFYDFYYGRIMRLAPSLGFNLVLTCLLVLLFGNLADISRFFQQAMLSLIALGNLGAQKHSGDYFNPNPNPFIHTWSLSVEVQLYLALPIMLLALRAIGMKITRNFMIWLFLLIFGSSLLYRIYLLTHTQEITAFYSPFSRAWQFSLGGILALVILEKNLFSKFTGLKISRLFYWVVLFSVLIPSLFLESESNLFFLTFSTVLIIILGKEVNFPGLLKPVLWLGDRSYSIYLIHLPLLYLAKYSNVFKELVGNNFVRSISMLGLSIALGSLSFSYIENSYRVGKTSKKHNLKEVIPKFIVLPIIAIGLLGSNTFLSTIATLPSPTNNKSSMGWANCNLMDTNDKPCYFGSPKARDLLLVIGDSHAAMLSYGIVKVGTESNLRVAVWTKSGCQFILEDSMTKDLSSESRVSEACLVRNAEILDYVKNNSPKYVVTSYKTFGSVAQLQLLRENLKVLKKYVPTLIHFGAIPDYSEASVFSKIPNQAYIFDNNFYSSELLKENISFINTYREICGSGNCDSLFGEFYQDYTHLNIVGGIAATKKLADIITFEH